MEPKLIHDGFGLETVEWYQLINKGTRTIHQSRIS